MDLQDKVVIITDGSGAKGKALAERFLAKGASLVINRSNQVLDERTIQDAKVLYTQADVCKPSEIETLLQQALSAYGHVDVLVFNNDISKQVSIEDCTEEVYDHIMKTNAKSAFFLTQIIGGEMVKAGRGKVIYIGSIHDEKPTGSAFVYSLSKGALKMLSHEAALELGRSGVDVHLVELGPISGDAERFESDLSGIYHDVEMKIPNKRLGTETDLADLVVFLSSDEARYLNGTDIRLDGGFTLYYMDK